MTFHVEGPYLEKSAVCTPVLRSLPEWFGIEEALVHYSNEIDHLPTFVACKAQDVVGFLSLKQHNPYSAEVYVMGVRPEVHRTGIGRALIERARAWLTERGVEYLQVKTLGPSRPNEEYAGTRVFYQAAGFRPLEEIEEIWGEQNPCLILIMGL